MKTLVLSDTHLTPQFDEKKFQILKRIIDEHDKVILNGDLWEGFLFSFDEFMSSQWSSLFPLLKKKDTVYLFGNHDLRKYAHTEQLVNFCVQYGDSYEFSENNSTFHIEHGHTYLPLGDTDPQRNALFYFTTHLWNTIEYILIKLGGTAYQRFLKKYNTTIKQSSARLRKNSILICGHTHSQEIDLEHNFANVGVCKYGLVQFLTIENGNMRATSIEY